MKVALVYTSTTPELIELVEREVGKALPDDVEVISYQDPSILADTREAGYVTAAPAARLIGMYMEAVEAGADAILNLCSSVGEVADEADVILFAQGSMAYCEDAIHEIYGKMVVSSPRFGALALRDALINKGMM